MGDVMVDVARRHTRACSGVGRECAPPVRSAIGRVPARNGTPRRQRRRPRASQRVRRSAREPRPASPLRCIATRTRLRQDGLFARAERARSLWHRSVPRVRDAPAPSRWPDGSAASREATSARSSASRYGARTEWTVTSPRLEHAGRSDVAAARARWPRRGAGTRTFGCPVRRACCCGDRADCGGVARASRATPPALSSRFRGCAVVDVTDRHLRGGASRRCIS